MPRFRSLSLLAPVARVAFEGLAAVLSRNTPLRPFETYRDPEMQDLAFRSGTSKARAFESAHQFGLAVDFVPFVDGHWNWRDGQWWEVLDREAAALGLLTPVSWDRPHVEHPAFAGVRRLTRAK